MPRPLLCRVALVRRRTRALTLLELLAVLVILSIVATLAVHSLQPRIESNRFDQACALLREIGAAALGSAEARQPDGTPMIQGFVADIGRPPQHIAAARTDSTSSGAFEELWNPQCALAVAYPFQFRPGPKQPVDYSDIRLPCGWRAPYLTLAVGHREIVDPWARPLELQTDPRGTILAVECRTPPPLHEPLRLDLSSGMVVVAGTVSTNQPPGATIDVVMLVPQPDRSTDALFVLSDEDPNANSFRFSSVPIGLRAICLRSGSQRIVKYVQVPRGGLTLNLNLEPAVATQP